MKFQELLLEFNKRGLIHAPDESDDQFLRRCRNASIVSSTPSSSLAKNLFDIDPNWVWMIYDNKGLHFWEGGCTWIKQDHVTVQLNKVFQNRGTFLGYTREEIIAHELVHVVRSSFEEPVFEEILAYQTSSSGLRRFFAPFFRSAKESVFFMTSLALCFIATVFDTCQQIALAGILCLVVGGSLRLLRAQRIFSRTRKQLTKLVGEKHVLAVMLRMTDREIIRFSKMDATSMLAYAQKMSKIHMRWQQITYAYFPG